MKQVNAFIINKVNANGDTYSTLVVEYVSENGEIVRQKYYVNNGKYGMFLKEVVINK